MSHTQKKELNRIPLGSMDWYVLEWTGTIPEDSVIETEKNMIGRTKSGASINYECNYYQAKSDDGKAVKNVLTDEKTTISWGLITWNADTMGVLVATASIKENSGKRTADVGGITNNNGKSYLLRGVHHDSIDGDIRVTAVGKNTGGWSAAFNPDSETIIQPSFECEPYDDSGHLFKYEEEIIEATDTSD